MCSYDGSGKRELDKFFQNNLDSINFKLLNYLGVSLASWMVGSGAVSVCISRSMHGSFRIHDFVRWLSCNWCYEAQSLSCMEIPSGWTYILCCCKYLKFKIFIIFILVKKFLMTTSYIFNFLVYDYHLHSANSLASDIRILGYYNADIHYILEFVQQSTCSIS